MARTFAQTHASAVEAAIRSDAAARSPVVASWSRSAHLHGLDPEHRRPPERLTEAELAQARERMEPLLKVAGPSLDKLFQTVGGVGCSVMLADSDGVPVERRGASVDDRQFHDWGLWTGAIWSEATEGTNGIGTALAERRAVTIHRDQHYLSRNTALSCMSAPVHDATGQIAGVLDVSSCRDDLTEGFAAIISHLVVEAARKIEADVFRHAFPRARIVLVPGSDRAAAALLAVDGDDLVVGATRSARQLLNLTGDLLAAPRPASDMLGMAGPDTLEDAERAVLQRALARHGGNVSAAARSLGISRATFHRKIGSLAQRS
ncbi:GAF domain-containing protein [Tabrizicola sp. J26]|uniref:GAF domain-containing protein n=1 Tax=Alitabrizicola rongguiensis TaxID=2909234 RepID=UPI001F2CBC16|nr:GAF domain-containing protein [Tabrizicola rongguiensis]MCF1710214.1 GAF domain-containing protein [Tabrizicola rongguiensis]